MHPFFPEGPIWFVAFLFSLTCHEAAHGAAAYLGGDRTAYYGGHKMQTKARIQHAPQTISIAYLQGAHQGLYSKLDSRWVWRADQPQPANWMAFATDISSENSSRALASAFGSRRQS